MPFQSQAQQHFAFGTGQPWAKRWADETDFSKLPKRVRRVRSRKVKGCTCGQATKEQLAPGITRIHGNLCNVHGRYGPCDASQSGKKPKGKKPRSAKPKKVPQTPEQRAQARQAQHEQNRASVAQQMADNDAGLSPSGSAALAAFSKGKQPDKAVGDGLVKMGLAEMASDGSYRMTGTGHAVINAMNAGDYQRAVDAISRGTDRSSARQEREAAHTQRQQAAAQRAQAVAQRRAQAQAKREAAQRKREQARKKPGGGGRAAAPAGQQDTAEAERRRIRFEQQQQDRQTRIERQQQRDAEHQQDRAARQQRQTASDEQRQQAAARGAARRESAANRTGRRRKAMQTYKAGSPGDYLVVEDRTKPSTWHLQVRTNGKPDHRLMGAAWAALHGGYRGNKYSGPNAGEALSKLRALYASEKMPLPNEKSADFTVYKDASGADRWISVSSTAYKDRDQEIVSTKALQGAVALADASGYRGPLRFWHVPGVEFGDCDFQATAQDGRFLIESGTFRSPALAAAVKERADAYQVSIGFTHPANEPDQNGVFSHIAIFERSLVPKGRASNPFTQVTLATKEIRMLTTEKATELEQLLGGNKELLNGLLGQVATTDKAAQEGGVAYKDDTPAWAQALIGRIEALETSLKASEEPAIETKDDGTGDMEAMGDGMDMASDGTEPAGDENMLTDAEISAIAQQTAQVLLEALMPHLGIGQKMDEVKSMLGGMAGSYAKKDAELAEVKEQLSTVKAQVEDLNGSQPRILSGGFRASQSPKTVTTDEKLKEFVPQADPVATSFQGFMQDLGLFGQQPQA